MKIINEKVDFTTVGARTDSKPRVPQSPRGSTPGKHVEDLIRGGGLIRHKQARISVKDSSHISENTLTLCLIARMIFCLFALLLYIPFNRICPGMTIAVYLDGKQ